MWGHVCFWDMVLLQRVLLLSWVYWRPCSRFGHWNWISPSGLLVGQIFLHLFMHFFGSSCPISSARKTYRPLSPGLLHSQQRQDLKAEHAACSAWCTECTVLEWEKFGELWLFSGSAHGRSFISMWKFLLKPPAYRFSACDSLCSVQDKTLWRRFFDAILEVERALAAHG